MKVKGTWKKVDKFENKNIIRFKHINI